jgi:hypothetical protein
MGHGFNGIQATLEGTLCLIWISRLPNGDNNWWLQG